MGKVAWGRGFFRVWLVLSVAWIIAAIVLSYGAITNPYIPLKAVATPAGRTVTVYDLYSEQPAEFRRGVTAGGVREIPIQDGHMLYVKADITQERLDERMAEARTLIGEYIVNERAARRSSAIATMVGWGLGVPFVLLVIGWAVGWAINGFRKTAAEH